MSAKNARLSAQDDSFGEGAHLFEDIDPEERIAPGGAQRNPGKAVQKKLCAPAGRSEKCYQKREKNMVLAA